MCGEAAATDLGQLLGVGHVVAGIGNGGDDPLAYVLVPRGVRVNEILCVREAECWCELI